ncbi:Single-stranded DNA-binding protein [subsurface metagenome]|nr:single-stranded DNA-binding protein [Clostridia bacterium]TET15376.1 MAG: single-stranded DNA-binding protein [Actinomycetota bacterium]
MAFGVNNITVLGNITRDPELRFTPSGTAVASFGLAVNRNVQNKNSGEWETQVDFFNVTAWYKLAENCAESLSKGDRVLVSGRLSQDSWESKDGQKRSTVKIIANVIAPSLEFASCRLEKNPRAEEGVSSGSVSGEGVSGGSVSGKGASGKGGIEEADFSDEDIPF